MYANCGAIVGNRRPKTKKELKEAIKANPSEVYFDNTSMYGLCDGYIADSIPDGIVVTVTGPDPYTKRNWYASVKRLPNGTIRVT